VTISVRFAAKFFNQLSNSILLSDKMNFETVMQIWEVNACIHRRLIEGGVRIMQVLDEW
jgi:hypothetical protein